MRKIIFAIGLMLLPMTSLALGGAVDCSSRVSDQANMIHDLGPVQEAAQDLAKQHVDVFVRSVPSANGNLDKVFNTYWHSCTGWQSGDGNAPKSTLIALFISKDHKIGLYPGAAFKESVGTKWNSILADRVVPLLHRGDISEGLAEGLKQAGYAITQDRYAQEHPANNGTTVINQPGADHTKFVVYALFGLLFILLAALVAYLVAKSKNKKVAEDKRFAAAKSAASIRINKLRSDLSDAAVLKPENARLRSIQSSFDALSQSYTDLSNQMGLVPAEYFDRISDRADLLSESLGNLDNPEVVSSIDSPRSRYAADRSRIWDQRSKDRASVTEGPSPTRSTSSPHHSHTTINNYNDSSPSVPVFIPIVEPSPIIVEDRDEPRSYRREESYSAGRNDDNNNGGSSVDYSSNSNDDNSGGSVDFSSDTGSGDSGGGSTDW